MNKEPTLNLGFLFFLYAATVAVVIQFIFLPYVFPSWSAGHGLVNSSLDSITFHREAVGMAQAIHRQGWSVWELGPQNQWPIGIAAAIYALTVPEPWTLIPLNAFLHAISGLLVLKIVMFFLPDWRKAFWCALPFVVYPSAASWYAQLHKDGYSILGLLLLVYGVLILAHDVLNAEPGHGAAKGLLLVFFGAWLMWVVRPYLFNFSKLATSLLAVVLGFFMICGCLRRKVGLRACLEKSAVLLLLFMMPLAGTSAKKIYDLFPALTLERPTAGLATLEDVLATAVPPAGPSPAREGIDKKIIRMRTGFIGANANAKSAVDNEAVFNDLQDIILYLPRAAQIVFLAPFPEDWFKEGSFEANTLMRRVAGAEMLGVYFALCFLPFAAFFWARHFEFWIMILFCSGLLVLHGLVVNNVGTLYRMRYGLLMLIVALGMAGFVQFLEVRRKKCAA